MLFENSLYPNEVSALLSSKRHGPTMERKFGPANNGPISGRDTYFRLVHGRSIGPELNNRSENLGMSSKGAINKSGPCKHCHKSRHKEETCWDLHGKLVDWMPKQNTRSRGYQAKTKNNSTQNGALNLEQPDNSTIFSLASKHPVRPILTIF